MSQTRARFFLFALGLALCAQSGSSPQASAPRIRVDAAILAALGAGPPADAPGGLVVARGPGPERGWRAVGEGALATGAGDEFLLDAAGLRFARRGSADLFTYSFESAAVGGVEVPAGLGLAPSLDATGAAVYARGGLVEKYLDHGGTVEQLFVFDSLPARGELVVEGRVTSTSPFDAARSGGQHLDYGSFVVSRAVAMDGAGRSALCRLSHDSGRLRITVPADFVSAVTRFPLTIDPLFGPLITLEIPGGLNLVAIRGTDGAYNRTLNEYFITFSRGTNAGGNDLDQMAVKVDASTGARLGIIIPIDTAVGANTGRAAVAWNNVNNTYLVAYFESEPLTAPRRIKGRILDASGTPTVPEFVISDLPLADPQFEEVPDCAFDGASFLVVWDRLQSGTDFNIHGRFVGPSGAMTAPSFPIDAGPAPTRRPALVCLPEVNRYLVAYAEATGAPLLGQIKCRTISTTGAVGAATPISSTTNVNHDWARIAYNPRNNECLVVWSSGGTWDGSVFPGAGRPLGINARRVGPTGIGIGTGSFNIRPETAPVKWLPDVTWMSGTNEYIATWAFDFQDPRFGVRLARITGGTDTLVENDTVVIQDAALDHTNAVPVARTGTQDVIVAFMRFIVPISHYAQRYQSPSPVLPPPPPPPAPPRGPDLTDNPSGDNSINDVCSGRTAAPTGAGAAGFAGLIALGLLLVRRRA